MRPPGLAPSPHPDPKAHLPALTGLRFFLAAWVVLHHLTGRGMLLDAWSRGLPAAGDRFIRGGYLAVGTFFVLSGFVLARGYAGVRWNWRALWRYGAARFARIYPVYLLSLAIVAPFIAAERVAGKAALVADYGLLLQGWTGRLPVGWNTPAWSLSCEVFFYACFPAAVVFAAGMGWRRAAALAGAACVLPPILMALGVPDMCKPVIHVADFLMGMAAARVYDLLLAARGGMAGRGAWLYLPACGASAVLIARPEMLGGAMVLNSALRPLNALLLIGFALGGGVVARGLATRVAVFLGKASYALYILHVPLLWWYKRWEPHLFGRGAGTGAGFAFVAGATAVSAAVFRWLEEPANRKLRGWLAGRSAGVR